MDTDKGAAGSAHSKDAGYEVVFSVPSASLSLHTTQHGGPL